VFEPLDHRRTKAPRPIVMRPIDNRILSVYSAVQSGCRAALDRLLLYGVDYLLAFILLPNRGYLISSLWDMVLILLLC
jgi:hypothetical protein